eukprot:CAMPEP_0197494790 /NCGR_PEP_ID=MMETSP1311-20131121/32270_1 /TAXON_ID=464262 /ORGANISM="Genus nov. species nov., Strain RCC856" /LENGTH=377 /DNA_ID=CAMNT_0043040231 /DNA_START=213 /DNA_END=1346 /DNA_ORIENTATION=+
MDPFAAHQQQYQPQQSHQQNQQRTQEPVFDVNAPEFSTPHFRMYEFKVRACPRTRAHDWTQCPFAHPGEKARRRDPRTSRYSAVPCPDYRKGTCKRGDACEYAHGVFECWLHPSRYRTQMCTDLHRCQRLVCFFAHNEGELRCPTDPTGATHLEAPPLQQPQQQQQVAGGLRHHAPLQQPAAPQQQQVHPGMGSMGMGAGYAGEMAPPGGLQSQLSTVSTMDSVEMMRLMGSLVGQQQQLAGALGSPTMGAAPHSPTTHADVLRSKEVALAHLMAFNQAAAAAAAAAAAMIQPSSPHGIPMGPERARSGSLGGGMGDKGSLPYHPLSPSSPLQFPEGAPAKHHHPEHSPVVKQCSSFQNLLQALPRSLSDVGLDQAA